MKKSNTESAGTEIPQNSDFFGKIKGFFGLRQSEESLTDILGKIPYGNHSLADLIPVKRYSAGQNPVEVPDKYSALNPSLSSAVWVLEKIKSSEAKDNPDVEAFIQKLESQVYEMQEKKKSFEQQVEQLTLDSIPSLLFADKPDADILMDMYLSEAEEGRKDPILRARAYIAQAGVVLREKMPEDKKESERYIRHTEHSIEKLKSLDLNTVYKSQVESIISKLESNLGKLKISEKKADYKLRLAKLSEDIDLYETLLERAESTEKVYHAIGNCQMVLFNLNGMQKTADAVGEEIPASLEEKANRVYEKAYNCAVSQAKKLISTSIDKEENNFTSASLNIAARTLIGFFQSDKSLTEIASAAYKNPGVNGRKNLSAVLEYIQE